MKWWIRIGLGTIDNTAASWLETVTTPEKTSLEVIAVLERAANEALLLAVKRAQRLDPIIFERGPRFGGSFFVRLQGGSIEMTAGPAEVGAMSLGTAAAAGRLAALHAVRVIQGDN